MVIFNKTEILTNKMKADLQSVLSKNKYEADKEASILALYEQLYETSVLVPKIFSGNKHMYGPPKL